MIRWLPSQTDEFNKKASTVQRDGYDRRMASMTRVSIESVIPCNTLTQETIWIFLKQNRRLVVVSLSKAFLFISLRLKLLHHLHNDAAELLAFCEILVLRSRSTHYQRWCPRGMSHHSQKTQSKHSFALQNTQSSISTITYHPIELHASPKDKKKSASGVSFTSCFPLEPSKNQCFVR